MKPPVSYQGGKARLAAKICATIGACSLFVDLCCGSGAITLEMVSRGVAPATCTMIDAGPWGMFWERIGAGTFSLERFQHVLSDVPTAPQLIQQHVSEIATHPIDDDAPYVFLILQAAAFGGKAIWDAGGKWQNASFRAYWLPTRDSSRRSPVNPMMPMPHTLYERVAHVAECMYGVNGLRCDVAAVVPEHGATYYIDPPYVGTTKYGHDCNVKDVVQRLSAFGDVWVSEARPLREGAICLSEGRSKGGISGNRGAVNEEWLTRFPCGM